MLVEVRPRQIRRCVVIRFKNSNVVIFHFLPRILTAFPGPLKFGLINFLIYRCLTVKVNRPKVNDNNKRRPNSAGKGKGQQGKGNNKGKGNKKEKREKEAPVAAGDLDKQMAACK